MGAGVQHIAAPSGHVQHRLAAARLAGARSRWPRPSRAGVSSTAGSIGESEVSGTRVALRGRSWIVFGESWDAGWKATCNGRSLGAPQVIDGYANGWLAPASCTHVAITFGPQAGIEHSYLASIVAVALMLLLLAFGLTRRASLITGAGPAPSSRRRRGRRRPSGRPRLRRPSLRTLPRALAIASLVALPLGYWFALRAGAALFVLVALVLWLALDNRTLILIAAGAARDRRPGHLSARHPGRQGRLQLRLQRPADLGPLDRRGRDRARSAWSCCGSSARAGCADYPAGQRPRPGT